MRLRVRFYELDPYDHVNHANYFNYCETARVEALAEVGYGLDVMKREGFQIVITDVAARFLAPAMVGEELEVETSLVELARVSGRWRQRIARAEEPIFSLELRSAFTDLAGRPRRMPDGFAQAVAVLFPS